MPKRSTRSSSTPTGSSRQPTTQPREIEHRDIRTGNYVRVTGTSILNIRSGPGTNYRVLGMLRGGEEIKVIQFSRGWAQIQSDDGYLTGWVSGRYLQSGNDW